jgi:hypothetical protein
MKFSWAVGLSVWNKTLLFWRLQFNVGVAQRPTCVRDSKKNKFGHRYMHDTSTGRIKVLCTDCVEGALRPSLMNG